MGQFQTKQLPLQDKSSFLLIRGGQSHDLCQLRMEIIDAEYILKFPFKLSLKFSSFRPALMH